MEENKKFKNNKNLTLGDTHWLLRKADIEVLDFKQADTLMENKRKLWSGKVKQKGGSVSLWRVGRRCHRGNRMLGVQGRVRILQKEEGKIFRWRGTANQTRQGLSSGHNGRTAWWHADYLHHRGVTWDEGRHRQWDGGGTGQVGREWEQCCAGTVYKVWGQDGRHTKNISLKLVSHTEQEIWWEGQWAVNSKQMNKPLEQGQDIMVTSGFSFGGYECTILYVCFCVLVCLT